MYSDVQVLLRSTSVMKHCLSEALHWATEWGQMLTHFSVLIAASLWPQITLKHKISQPCFAYVPPSNMVTGHLAIGSRAALTIRTLSITEGMQFYEINLRKGCRLNRVLGPRHKLRRYWGSLPLESRLCLEGMVAQTRVKTCQGHQMDTCWWSDYSPIPLDTNNAGFFQVCRKLSADFPALSNKKDHSVVHPVSPNSKIRIEKHTLASIKWVYVERKWHRIFQTLEGGEPMLTQPTKASRRIKSERRSFHFQEDFGFLNLVVPLGERLLSKRHQSSSSPDGR